MERKRGPVLLRSKGRGVFRKAVSLVASAALALSMVPAVALADDDTSATEFTAPTHAVSAGHDAGVITIGTHAAAEPTAYYLGLDNTTWRERTAVTDYDTAITSLRLGVFGSEMNEYADNYLWNQFYNLWVTQGGGEGETTEDVPQDDGNSPSQAGGAVTISTRPDILLSISSTADSSYAALIGALDENNDDDPDNDYTPLLVPYDMDNFVTFINTTYNVAAAADKVAEESGYTLNSRYVLSGSYDSVTAIAEAYEDFYQGSQWYILSQIEAGTVERASIAYVTGYNSSAETVTLSATDASEFGSCDGAGRPGEALRNVTDNVAEELGDYDSSTTSYTVNVADLVSLAPDYIIYSGNDTSVAATLESALETAGLDVPIISGQPSSIVVLNSNSSESAIYIAYYLGFIYNDILPMSDMLAWYYRNLFHVTESNVANAISITCSNISVPDGTSLTGFSDDYSDTLSAKFAEGREYYEANEDAIVAEWPNLMSNDYYEENILIPLTSENVELTGIGTYTSTNQQSGETSTSTGIYATVVYTGGSEDVTLTEWDDYTYTYTVVSFADGVETSIPVGSTIYSIQYAGTYIMHLEGANDYSGGADITFTFDGENVEVISIEDIEDESDESGDDEGTGGDEGDGSDEGSDTSATEVERLAGVDRYDTMQQVVDFGLDSAEIVIVTTGDNFPDALAASGLAGALGAALVTTSSSSDNLTTYTKAAIENLGATQAIILGATDAVSAGVVEDLEDMGIEVIARYDGATRFETAEDMYEANASSYGRTAIVTSGEVYADALSVASYAYQTNSAIFLTNSSGEIVCDDYLTTENFDQVIILGGSDRVSADTRASLIATFGEDNVTQLGANSESRYTTSAEIVAWAASEGYVDYSTLYVATGENFADALASGVPAGVNGNAVLLVNPNLDSYSITACEEIVEANASAISQLVILGDQYALGYDVEDYLKDLLGWE